jgi:hypothetical protein
MKTDIKTNVTPISRKFNLNQKVQILEALLSRARLAAKLGYQYGTNRNLYEALGYKVDLIYDDYAVKYERQDIAKAVINRPVEATWNGEFGIIEADEENETALEKAWQEIDEKMHFKQVFSRLDKLASLGTFGVLFIGFDDVTNVNDLKNPVRLGRKRLLYLKPLGQGSATVNSWDQDSKSPRYGLPNIYDIVLKNPGGTSSQTVQAHFSRIIHVPGEVLESETDGVPALQCVYNRLDDLEKIVGGSGEMFWRGARPGFSGNVDKEATLGDTEKEDMEDQIDEYEHNLRRILLLEGIDLKALQSQVSDPVGHIDAQIQMISAVTGIPKRILVGSERGELSSSQDQDSWLQMIKSRRENYAELQIVRPFVDRLIEFGILPKAAKTYSVKWQDLFAMSEKEQADIGKVRAESIASYVNAPGAEVIFPQAAFYRNCLGLPPDEIDLITEESKQAEKDEEKQVAEEERIAKEAAEEQQTSLQENPPPGNTAPQNGQQQTEV